MQVLKLSTTATILVGPVLDPDGAAYTSAVIGDFQITKNGSTAALAAAATATHSHNGMYLIALTTDNTDTVGRLEISMNKATYGMTNHRYHVFAAQVFDSLVAASDLLQVDIAQLENSATNAARILIGANSNHEVMVTGSNHVAADIHELQPAVISAGDFAAGAIDASALASDAASEVASAVRTNLTTELGRIDTTISSRSSQTSVDTLTTYVDTEVAAIKAKTDNLPNDPADASDIAASFATVNSKLDAIDDYVDTEVAAIKAKTDNLPSDPADASDIVAAFTEIKGSGWSSSSDTLEKIADASGSGGSSIVVTPVVAQVPVRATATTISTFKGDKSAITVGVFDALDPVDLSALPALEVCIQTKAGTDLQLIAAGSITISGSDNNYFTFSPNSTAVGTVGRFMWSLRVAASNSKQVIAYGPFVVEDAALAD